MSIRLAVLGMALSSSLIAQYSYDYSQNPTVQDNARWTTNSGSNVSYGAGGVTFSGTGGSLIDIPAISGTNANDYEVKGTLTALSGGGTFIEFLRAGSSTVQAGTGSYVSVELVVPTGFSSPGAATLHINQSTSGSVSAIAAVSVTATDGMTLRSVIWGSTLWVFINDVRVWTGTVTATTGNPGFGGSSMPTGHGFLGVALGHRNTTSPVALNRNGLRSASTPTQVLLRWAGVNAGNGPGIWTYSLSRQDPLTGNYSEVSTTTQADDADPTVSAGIAYNYALSAVDFHGNSSTPLLFSVTTPLADAVDPRRTGTNVRGVYWGSGEEQIDTLSGNLHFSMPLLRPQGRTGWTVPIDLIYDSQLWRQDAGNNWRFGIVQGVGIGWKIQVGSITPYYTEWYNGAQFYVYTDHTGAEYRLDFDSGGVWSSSDSAYVWYEENTNRLHFKDGTFWVMGSITGGTSKDAGTRYPTVIEDANGNQVLVTYTAANTLPAGAINTSANIASIEDVRGKGSPTYTFTYSGTAVSISNSIGTPETWTLDSSTSATMAPPFGADGIAWGVAPFLHSVTGATGISHTFTYDISGSGELTRVDYPDGGHIRWVYGTATYSGSRLLREVTSRYVANSPSATEWGPYTFTHDDSANPSPTIHANTTLVDASGVGAKTWKFNVPDGNPAHAWKVGLVSDFLQKPSAAATTALTHESYTWSTNSSKIPFISAKTTVLDEGQTYAKTMSATMTSDAYGNATSQAVTDFTATLARTYTNTYLHSSNSSYDNAYLRGLPLSSSMQDYAGGGHTVTLSTNTYDQGTLAAVSSAMEFDGVQGATTNHVRGNVTQSVAMGATGTVTYDQTGQALTGMDATGSGGQATYSSTTNNAAPAAGTPMAGTPDAQNGHSVTQAAGSTLSSSYGYNSALSLVSSAMPNAATTSQTFSPSTGLLSSSVSVHGATTNYAYTFNPTTVTATTGGHWTKAYKDGFGRDLALETGNGTTIVSHVDYQYGPCACSPLGKVNAQSLPYAIGSGGTITASDGTANIAWSSFVYDGLGRTVTQTAPDGSVTSYLYKGNTTKVTDPAGNWKRQTTDALGNLVTVEEPNPVYLQADNVATNFVTNYSYDLESHLTQVQMPRPTGTQYRTFNFDLPTGHLLSAANPENGTVTYDYYASGRLKSKVDAKGQKVLYSYDGYGRMAYIDRFPNGTTWDQCQSVALNYDASTTATNVLGRVASTVTGPCSGGRTLTESWSYSPGGLVTTKGYSILNPDFWDGAGNYYSSYTSGPFTPFTYDNEGRMTGYGPFSYTLDSMGRPTGLTETGTGTVWVQNAQYGPGGEMKTMQYRTSGGAYYTENRTFNKRGQMIQQQASGTGLTGMNLQYVYTAGANNGQIAQTNDLIMGETMQYAYDSLKRLVTAEALTSSSTLYGQSFVYDGFGNLTGKNPTSGHVGTAMSLTVDPATNHVTTSGFSYDANGNATSIAAAPSNISLTYDVENRTGGTWFDQQNQPLDRAGGPWNVYGLRGERMGTYTYPVTQQIFNMGTYLYIFRYSTETQASRNVYFAGRLIQSNGQTVVTDRTGSVRANEAGSTFKYYSYGEETTLANPQDREKFGTYTRESATGLDYAGQRYYDSGHGRMNSPDRYTASARGNDPNTWNRYAHVGGDPANFIDITGRERENCGSDWQNDASRSGPCTFGLPAAECGADNFLACDSGSVQLGDGAGGDDSHPNLAALKCTFSGDATTPVQQLDVQTPLGNGTSYSPTIWLNYLAAGGTGYYSWDLIQSVSVQGYLATDQRYLRYNGTPGRDNLLPGEIVTSGNTLNFVDSPGAWYPTIPTGRLQGANVLAFNFIKNFTVDLTLTSGAQTVKCPTVLWSANVSWSGTGKPTGTIGVTGVWP